MVDVFKAPPVGQIVCVLCLGSELSQPANQISFVLIDLIVSCAWNLHDLPTTIQTVQSTLEMASSVRPLSRMVSRPHTAQCLLRQPQPSPPLRAAAQFHSSPPRNATPSGPPPQGFRLPRPQRFDEGESSINKAGNYFLLTEIFRGMYVVLEQFFRPP